MLFFKEMIREKLADPRFNAFYERHCHICAVTVTLIARFEEDPRGLNRILDRTGMRQEQWQRLRDGDCCDPRQVFELCEAAGMDVADRREKCPRYLETLT